MSGAITSPFIGAVWGMSSELSLFSASELQCMLKEAVLAKHSLSVGTKEVIVTYGNGDGNRSVTFTRATLANLNSYIEELKMALGMQHGRARAIRVRP